MSSHVMPEVMFVLRRWANPENYPRLGGEVPDTAATTPPSGDPPEEEPNDEISTPMKRRGRHREGFTSPEAETVRYRSPTPEIAAPDAGTAAPGSTRSCGDDGGSSKPDPPRTPRRPNLKHDPRVKGGRPSRHSRDEMYQMGFDAGWKARASLGSSASSTDRHPYRRGASDDRL